MRKDVNPMTKDRLTDSLNKMLNGMSAGQFRQELETLITLVVNAKDEDITAAWEDYQSDK